jgi:hypothetical protein
MEAHVTAGNILLVIVGKLALGGALFFVLVSFGLWLAKVGFFSQRESDEVT